MPLFNRYTQKKIYTMITEPYILGNGFEEWYNLKIGSVVKANTT